MNILKSMDSLDTLSKFKHLFNSLELIVNSDQKELIGINFDKEVNKLTNVSEDKVATWHEFYNRVKHKNKNDKHMQTFIAGRENLPNWLPDLKECCSIIILMKL